MNKICKICRLEQPDHKMSCKDSNKEYVIPKAEEFLEQQYKDLNIKWKDGELKSWRDEDITILINFAKLHVKAAIKACIEDAPSGSSTDTVSYEDVVEALKDSYPLTNIK